jgi:3-oxoacyl-[acyl-carrier protein] reductase
MSQHPAAEHPDPDARVAVVTGAAGGHGAGVAEALRAAGWRVTGLDADAGPGVLPVDLVDPVAVRRAVDDLLVDGGRVDLLVTAADHRTGRTIDDLDAGAWDEALDVHLRGVVHAWQAVLPAMVRRGSGSIVAVLPAEAIAGEDEPGRSAAASAALGAMRGLAREYGPTGIVVNAVAPKAGPWSVSGDAAPSDVGATVLHLAEGDHYFAGQVLTPAGSVA